MTFHPTPSQAMNCVAYVRSVTGFDLSGNAYQWWNSAAGVYERGHRPEPGSVMVFARTRGMRDGHVAVVRSVRGSREILIDQANWVQGPHGGAITKAVSVIDVSPDNDWTQVRVEWLRSGSYGRVNPVDGFIYADGDSRGAVISARYLESKSKTAVSNEECLTPPPVTSHARGKAHHVVVKHHAKAHITTAAFHVGADKHHTAKVTEAVEKTASHRNMVKLRHTVLVYHNKTANKVMAEKGHPNHLVHVAAKTVIDDPHHAAKAPVAKVAAKVETARKPVAKVQVAKAPAARKIVAKKAAKTQLASKAVHKAAHATPAKASAPAHKHVEQTAKAD
ncbi:MAG TPA: CHAP domain-containing protein [Stellaceae bacterium]|nr:CHAP domain-containing protein [Stellaceae bacterium]